MKGPLLMTAPVINVIGIGNTILTDDGIGLAILEQLQENPLPGVNYIDGGTSGMELLPDILDADYLLVLDGLKQGTPGEVHTFIGDQVPRLMTQNLSPHQVGLLDLLNSAKLLGQEPEKVAVVGIVAESVALNVGMTDTASSSVPNATRAAQEILQEWMSDVTN